jgi:hypothetical protein
MEFRMNQDSKLRIRKLPHAPDRWSVIGEHGSLDALLDMPSI